MAVAAAPDAVRGDEVLACVVRREPLPDDDLRRAGARSIVAACLQQLAYYKAPGYVAFVDALPLTPSQKVQRGAAEGAGRRRCPASRTASTRVR